MLTRLDTALSPVGMAAFLTGAVEPWVRERAQDRFASEGDDVVGSWAPLQPATVDVRSRGEWAIGGEHPINKRTGELENYITKSNGKAWPHALGATLTYPGKPSGKKSIVEKMKTAQTGRSHPRTVARPVLGLNERDLLHVLTSLAFYVKGSKA